MVLQITRTDLNMTGNIYASANLNISGTTLLRNALTCLSTLNVVGDVNTSGLSVFTINSNVNNFL